MKRFLASLGLWVLAVVVTVGLAAFQRKTGPSYPVEGSVEIGGVETTYELPRSHGGAGGLEIRIPAPEPLTGALEWRRYPTAATWEVAPMVRREGALEVAVPHQPPAGKVEYRILLAAGDERASLPRDEAVVARFRGDVPAPVLATHILGIFLSMLFSTRALLETLARGREAGRGLVLTAMALLIVGGLILGPVVQKYAFGALWTGWPHGTDLTDNKTAVAFLAWLPATILAWRRRTLRLAVVGGWIVMMTVFLIPHSLRGSQLDWEEHGAGSNQPSVTSSSSSSSEGTSAGSSPAVTDTAPRTRTPAPK